MIIDASVAFKWLFIEENSAEADALIGTSDLKSPPLLLVEVGNALWKKVANGELDAGTDFGAQIALLDTLVEPVEQDTSVGRAIEMAVAMSHPIYDCIYLAIAESLGDIVVTADRRFAAKVQRSPWNHLIRELANG